MISYGDPVSTVIPGERDTRPRWQRIAPVLTVGVAGLSAALVIAAVDPNDGHYPACPTQALLGVDCPGCGGLRSAHALVRGDIATAADHNIAALIVIPLAVAAYLWWLRRTWRGWSPDLSMAQFRRRNRILLAGVLALIGFGIARNFIPYLGSGLVGG